MTIRATRGVPGFAQFSVAKLPEFGPQPPGRADLARVLGIAEKDLLAGATGPEAASCGLPFLFVPVRDRSALTRAVPRLDEFERVFASYWTSHVFVFCADPELPGSH
ncbi:MAG: hypothetical protein E6H78_16850, partial [Betaproteobacteria bacterium]